VKDTVLGCQAQ